MCGLARSACRPGGENSAAFAALPARKKRPSARAFVCFRRELAARGLDRRLFEAIARDLEAKGATIRKGTIIDARGIGPASKGDPEAAFGKHRPRPPAPGGFAHIAAAKDTGIIRAVATPL
jgi:transposase, IS5 family